jgi:hypothetical protein
MENFRHQGPTNIMHHHTKFIHLGRLVPGICAPLNRWVQIVLHRKILIWKQYVPREASDPWCDTSNDHSANIAIKNVMECGNETGD